MRILFIVVGILEVFWGVVSLLFEMEDVAKGASSLAFASFAYAIAFLATGIGFVLMGILKYALNWRCVAAFILLHFTIYASGEVCGDIREHGNYLGGLFVTGALFISAIVCFRNACTLHKARNKQKLTQQPPAFDVATRRE